MQILDQTKALFQKIKGTDSRSFRLLTETYGWKLYSHIRLNVSDRETADQIFRDTLIRFHTTMDRYDCEDPIEAMLCLYADEVGRNQILPQEERSSMGQWQIARERDFALPEPSGSSVKRKHTILANVLYSICLIILIAFICAALWVLVGILVDMGFFPRNWDFGYSWFNENITDWF